jgi:hypothetical protein
MCPAPGDWFAWPQVVIALPNASRFVTNNASMLLAPLCVPNPFVKHMYFEH